MSPDRYRDEDVVGSATPGGGILVVCQARDDQLDATDLNLMGQARAWAEKLAKPGEVWGLVMGPAPEAGRSLGPQGARRVYCCPALDVLADPDIKARTACRLAMDLDVGWVFLIDDGTTAELGPRLAYLTQSGLVSRCLGLEQDGPGRFVARRPLHQGRLHQRQFLLPITPRLISWSPEALAQHRPRGEAQAPLVPLEAAGPSAVQTVRPLGVRRGDPATLPLEEAERIVALGRGMLPHGLALVEQVAGRLEATVGATRPVIDAGLLPFPKQIGQTGAAVAPRLLLTAGVSGANEFTVGIRGARRVVAVNTDPGARIFQLSDLGLVGDAQAVLTALLERIGHPGAEESGQE